LRAPALIAVVKDLAIYITIIVAVIYIPSKLGGYGHIFDVANNTLPKKTTPSGTPAALIPAKAPAQTAYATLALGSALALFMYPHVITGALSSKSQDVVRRNMAILPAYSLLLGFIALLGYMAIAAGIKPSAATFAVPDLFIKYFPSWFEGFAFAAIAIGALVPAAVMSIASANLFTRNIWREYVHADADDHEQTRVARWASLFMKAGALAFVLFLPQKDAINLQLLGGVWIIQTLPSVLIGLLSRWFDRRALLVGWLAGMVAGTWIAASQSFTPTWLVTIFGVDINAYTAIWAVALNLVVTVVLTLVFRATGKVDDTDETTPADYEERVETGRPAPVAAAPTG
jgi:SSS family solute:Na+ symporter